MSLQNLGKVSSFIKGSIDAIDGMDIDDVVKALTSMNLDKETIWQALWDAGLGVEDIEKATVSLEKMGTSGEKSTSKLSSAFKGLWQIMKAHPIASITTAVVALGAIGYQAYKKYQEYIQECVDAASEAASAWSEQNSAIDSYSKRIDELRTALDNGTLSEEEAYQAKAELLSIQQDLTESYRNQVVGIDLVNGSLQEQLNLLRDINVEEANKLLNEGRTGTRL